MSVNSTQSSNTTLKFAGANSEIKLSEIQSFFGGNSNNVRFGKYFRKTSTSISESQFGQESSGHFVPDATENNTIPSSQSNMSFSDFRGNGNNGVLKKYIINQATDQTDENLNLATSSFWNSNLNKNVPKQAKLNGRCYSTSAPTNSDGSGYNHQTSAAVRFNAEAYNLDIDINGTSGNTRGIWAEGGDGGTLNAPSGKMGGTAMYIQQNSNLSNNSSIINVNTDGGRVLAGGGGGVAGRSGNTGDTAECVLIRNFNETVTNNGFTIRGQHQCNNNAGAKCDDSKSITYNLVKQPQSDANAQYHTVKTGYPNNLSTNGWGGTACNGSGGRCRCRGGGRNRGCGDASGCYNTITKICRYNFNFPGNTGTGGDGGTGGKGKGQGNDSIETGWNQGTNTGNCPSCDPLYLGLAGPVVQLHKGANNDLCGNGGNPGTKGGSYGAPGVTPNNNRSGSVGAGGHAIFSNTKSRVKVSNTNNNAGQMNNITT